MKIQGYSRQHSGYRLNSLLNIGNLATLTLYCISKGTFILNDLLSGTFLIFRILTLGWMTRWLVVHRDQVPFLAYTMGSIGILTFNFL